MVAAKASKDIARTQIPASGCKFLLETLKDYSLCVVVLA
jgi:hypothetical protein